MATEENGIFKNISKNILDTHDNATYHFRLFVTELRGRIKIPAAPSIGQTKDYSTIHDVLSGSANKSDPILLAETGATAVSINDVEIEIIPVSNYVNKTSTATNISFSIAESNSATFLDDMRSACVHLNINNFTKATYYLELTFKGRHRETSEGYDYPDRWLYPIIITEMDTNITSSGSDYTVNAVSYDDLAHDEYDGVLQSNWKDDINEFTNAKDMINALSKKLNEHLDESSEGIEDNKKAQAKNKYAIFIDDQLVKQNKLDFLSKYDKINRNEMLNAFNFTTNDDGGQQFNITKGTSITTVIDNVLLLSSLLKVQKKDKNTEHVKLYKIITKVCPINPATKVSPIIGGIAGSDALAKSDEVNEIVSMNNETNDYSKCIVYHVVPYEQYSVLKNPKEADTTSSAKLINSIKDTVIKKYDYVFTGLNDQVYNFDINFKFNYYQNFQGPLGSKYSTYSKKSQSNTGVTEPLQKKVITQEFAAKDKAAKTENTKLQSLSLHTTHTSLIGDPSGEHSYFNDVMSNALAKGQPSGDMINLELDIKGDPHWLGKGLGKKGLTYYRLALAKEEKGSKDTPNYEYKVPALLFRALPPQEYNNDTGMLESAPRRGGSLINGICYVVAVTNIFSGGQFKQKLTCFRDVYISAKHIEMGLDGKNPPFYTEQQSQLINSFSRGFG